MFYELTKFLGLLFLPYYAHLIYFLLSYNFFVNEIMLINNTIIFDIIYILNALEFYNVIIDIISVNIKNIKL